MKQMPQSRLNHWKLVRKSLFWFHLAIGVISGIFIASMCVTGSIMAFEDEVLHLIDPHTVVAQGAKPLGVSELLTKVKESHPELIVQSVEVHSDPESAWRLRVGRKEFKLVNPYTGEFIQSEAAAWKKFFHQVEEFHRWLLVEGDTRSAVRHVTGVANLCFAALAMTGLYLWFPRKATWKMWKNSLLYKRGAKAKARDFNWHNVTGFWILLPLAVITFTGTTFHYDWAKNLTEKLFGDRPSDIQHPAGNPNVTPLTMDEHLAIASADAGAWQTITVPTDAEAPQGSRGKGRGEMVKNEKTLPVIMVHDGALRFPNMPTQIVIDPESREIVARRSSEDFTLAQGIRASMKTLHTGEAGFLVGKIIAFAACIGGLVLVYTGFALSFRRLRRRMKMGNV